jgi:hypothetical protein
MAVSKEILKRISVLESLIHESKDGIFIYADGHKKPGDIYNFIEVIKNEGPQYLEREPQDRIVDYQSDGGADDGLYSAIFKSIMKSIES